MVRIATTAAMLLTLTAVASATTADARRYPESSCAFDAATAMLTVVSANTRTVVKRRGSEIVVSQSGTGPRACSGAVPTVTAVDLIRIQATDGALVTLDLRGGPLAPGATSEADGSSEIEIDADLEFAALPIHGS